MRECPEDRKILDFANGRNPEYGMKLKRLIETPNKTAELITEIERIISLDNAHSIKFLLSNGYKIKPYDKITKVTPIHLAYMYNSRSILDSIFCHCKKVKNYTDCTGRSHLHIACLAGKVKAIRNFIINGENINEKCVKGYTSLHYAVKFEQKKAVKLLLEAKANMKAKDVQGLLPLHLACQVRNISDDTINYFLRPGLVPFTNPSLKIIKLLVKYNCPVNIRDKNGRTPLFHLFHKSYYKIFQSKIMKIFGHPICSDKQFLNLIRRRQKEKLQFLLANGADITARANNGDTILHWAIQNLEPTRIPKYHNEINFDDRIQIEMIKIMLEWSVNINALDSQKKTPLQYAIHYMSVDLVKLLLEHGADISVLKFDAFPRAFQYPDIFPTLQAVENVLDIIEILQNEGFELKPTDHSAILDFFVFNNDYCMFTDEMNHDFESFNLAHFGTPFGIFRSLERMCSIIRKERSRNLAHRLSFYTNIYVEKELIQKFNIKPNAWIAMNREHVNKMKEIKLNNKHSLYNIMRMNPRDIYHYLRNKDYRRITRASEFEKNYGVTCRFIEGHIAKALTRGYIVDLSISYFKKLIPITLPDICYELIANYIDSEYVWAICSAFIGI